MRGVSLALNGVAIAIAALLVFSKATGADGSANDYPAGHALRASHAGFLWFGHRSPVYAMHDDRPIVRGPR